VAKEAADYKSNEDSVTSNPNDNYLNDYIQGKTTTPENEEQQHVAIRNLQNIPIPKNIREV